MQETRRQCRHGDVPYIEPDHFASDLGFARPHVTENNLGD